MMGLVVLRIQTIHTFENDKLVKLSFNGLVPFVVSILLVIETILGGNWLLRVVNTYLSLLFNTIFRYSNT